MVSYIKSKHAIFQADVLTPCEMWYHTEKFQPPRDHNAIQDMHFWLQCSFPVALGALSQASNIVGRESEIHQERVMLLNRP
jgi:hypothetical protein